MCLVVYKTVIMSAMFYNLNLQTSILHQVGEKNEGKGLSLAFDIHGLLLSMILWLGVLGPKTLLFCIGHNCPKTLHLHLV